MKIPYQLIKKIHLYACLSTVAVLIMFIFTSYLMINYKWLDHEQQQETGTFALEISPTSTPDWKSIVDQHQIKGRQTREWTNEEGNLIREYASAGGSTRITILSNEGKMEIIRSAKSTADAIIGIHRQRGYGGPIQYSLYAFLLDLLAISLILFTITGIIMWFKLLKNDWLAWAIFIIGFIYFSINMALLMYW